MDRLFEVEQQNGSSGLGPGMLTIGAASEHLAIARLLELGHRVAVPVVDDDGVDLIVNYRVTVQVKSSQLHDRGDGFFCYRFWVTPERGSEHPRTRDLHVDVFLLHGRETNEWWVVAGEDVGSARRLSRRSGVGRDLENWDLFDLVSPY